MKIGEIRLGKIKHSDWFRPLKCPDCAEHHAVMWKTSRAGWVFFWRHNGFCKNNGEVIGGVPEVLAMMRKQSDS